jgi:superfamily I DNA and/or RNA helicase/very-short-patch-repair endonuclease
MTPSSPSKEEPKAKGVVPFVKEVARYFMDFLETDFHKVRNPKRHIQYRDNNNLQICVDLAKYKKYNALAWKVIRSGFQDDAITELKRGVHTNQISQTLLQLIEEQIASIELQEINALTQLFENEITIGLSKYSNDTTAASSYAIDGIARVIREKFISIFVANIREPLEKIRAATVDSIYQLEEELTNILINPFEEVVPSIINQLSLGKEVNTIEQLHEIFDLQDVQGKLESFFKGFSVGDLFLEVLELVNNKTLLDKQELYLYFCDITFKNYTYPLFYIPIQIEKTNTGFVFNFDSLLYVNKKAIQFVAQDYNLDIERKGSLSTFLERIIYLSEKRDHLIGEIDRGLKEAINYFGLTPYIDLNNPEKQAAKGKGMQITNRCYLGLFDKADESLVNDYEEILQKLEAGDNCLAAAFQLLVDDFITNNPIAVFSEKLVYASPVPLNEEQRQILLALNKSNCKYITVEGPPGTGKSHTITAIVCDAILKNQSVLVLSDKKEALDVVEDKITETMNKVRSDKDFQNPILRLGQAGNTYSKILATTSMDRIKEHYKATKSVYQKLETNIDKFSSTLKEQLNNTVNAYEKIKLPEIAEFTRLEAEETVDETMPVDLVELYEDDVSHDHLLSLRNEMISLKRELSENNLDHLFRKFYPHSQDVTSFRNFLTFITIVDDLRSNNISDLKFIFKIRDISSDGLTSLEYFVGQCQQLKLPLLGYIFKGKKINALCQQLNASVPNDFDQPQHNLDHLKRAISLFHKCTQYKLSHEISSNFVYDLDFIKSIHQLLILSIQTPNADERKSFLERIATINSLLARYKKSIDKIGVNENDLFSFINNKLTQYPEDNFNKLMRFLYLKNNLSEDFINIPEYSYSQQKKSIEEIVTAQMAYKVDERVVEFLENYRNDAKTLSSIISKKQRFDKAAFEKLKNSFPCILAGIRDFAEYIPLENEIFDLVIIDEASQVSIAQAFPALLRGKKIVVLGDRRQFSNVKSAQARSTTNREYLNRLEDTFTQTISEEPIKLARLEKFNIKTSILDFFERITNYNMMLKKHFRGYKELISYSSKYFYQDTLQAIKIRSKPIDTVIKFILIPHDGRIELVPNTNQLEIEAIVTEIERIAKEEKNNTIGIITPHTNQQKLLNDVFLKHPDNIDFYKNHKLKIMTFDTCQGEERDIIIYSMVASDVSDKLWGVFIKDRNSCDQEESGQIKLQRLNVGFSRAKERMQFFISKPIEGFNGSIGEALLHYNNVLEDTKKIPEVSDTDPRSPMEKKVLSWLQETVFFKSNNSSIEVQTQFPLGEYLKQLDKHYSHPLYVVDFLLVYTDKKQKEYKVIIEYDGFEYHFQNDSAVDSSNYGEYYTEEHIYREKVLESYGYNFLRLNRFNVGKNPIEMLNQRLENLVKKNFSRIAQ